MKKIYLIILVSIVFFGCSSTNNLTIDVMEPAPISLPNDIETVAVIGRTKTSGNTSTLNKIDQVLSAELLKIDSTASRKALAGLYDELSKNTKFTKVTLLNKIELENSAISIFSPVLTKTEVDKLCTTYDLDALFVLEFYDTETSVAYSVEPVTINALGLEINAVETMASVTTLINAGWRIYDWSGDILYDEFAYRENVTSTGRGINPMNALAAVVGQKDAVENTSYVIGQEYGISLLPYYTTVSRIYFVRGTDNFKIAKRRARTGDWDGAADLWLAETTNPKMKVAGRAYYNMAIINEINGDLETAIDWAQKSYADYGCKKALRYVNVLKNRKIRVDELKRQQGE